MTGKLRQWRVYGLEIAFRDRPPGGIYHFTNPPPGLHVTIGEIPPHMVSATRQFATRDVPEAESGGRFAQTLADQAEARLRDAGVADWLTLEYSEDFLVELDFAVDPPRFVQGGDVNNEMLSFSARASAELDSIFLRNFPAINGLRPSGLLDPGELPVAYIENLAPRWPIIARPRTSLTINLTGWERVSLGFKSERLEKAARDDLEKRAGKAGRWLTAAMAELDDPMRRFLFAFWGLEILCNTLGKSLETGVIDEIENSTRIPMGALGWPSDLAADRPTRNLVFRFAVCAIALNRDEALVDVHDFRRLMRSRNELSHGSGTEDHHELPADETVALLRKYLALAVLHMRSKAARPAHPGA